MFSKTPKGAFCEVNWHSERKQLTKNFDIPL